MVAPLAYAEQADGADPEIELNGIFQDLGEPLNELYDKPCIQEITPDGQRGDDEGYIITIIEEPFNPEPINSTANGDDYVSRICYRNYFSFTSPNTKKEFTRSELSTECSQKGQEALLGENQKIYNIKFTCQQVQVLLTKGGASAIQGYINVIYRWAAGIIGLIAVVVIILSGVQISLAGGDSNGVDEAKKRIIQSLLAIALLFLSGVILNFINPNFFVA